MGRMGSVNRTVASDPHRRCCWTLPGGPHSYPVSGPPFPAGEGRSAVAADGALTGLPMTGA